MVEVFVAICVRSRLLHHIWKVHVENCAKVKRMKSGKPLGFTVVNLRLERLALGGRGWNGCTGCAFSDPDTVGDARTIRAYCAIAKGLGISSATIIGDVQMHV